jgi:NAD(P)-dependent dehydrogenase (short-subunit alcohol dehydrogenase family)
MNVKDRSVLVTGASRGLGAALARELGARGARLVLVARDESKLRAVADDIRRRGGEAYAVPADVGDKEAIHPLAGTAAALVGPIDVVIHNASTLGPTPLRPLLDTECEDLSRVLEVNLVGPFRLTKALAGSMALRRTGVVIHVTSDASIAAYPEWGAYSISKAALDHLTRLWAAELDLHGVKFFGVDPGEMDTDMHEDALPGSDRHALAAPAEVAARIARMLAEAEGIKNGARLEAWAWKDQDAPGTGRLAS